jgi:hypothetical protein
MYKTPRRGAFLFAYSNTMFITYITDCADSNTVARQATRLVGLFETTPTFAAVRPTLDTAAELEAAGMLVDVLDAAGDEEGIVLVNVAPRSGNGKQYENGTPFGYFKYRNTLVLTTVAGVTLSLLKQVSELPIIEVFDLPGTVAGWVEQGRVSEEEGQRITGSQFRSFDFLPRAAHAVYTGYPCITAAYDIHLISSIVPSVFFIDCFGNAKTTLTRDDIGDGTTVDTVWGSLPLVRSLRDVPEGQAACIVGSSGLAEARFLEIET